MSFLRCILTFSTEDTIKGKPWRILTHYFKINKTFTNYYFNKKLHFVIKGMLMYYNFVICHYDRNVLAIRYIELNFKTYFIT